MKDYFSKETLEDIKAWSNTNPSLELRRDAFNACKGDIIFAQECKSEFIGDVKKCNCDIQQLMRSGCICGGK